MTEQRGARRELKWRLGAINLLCKKVGRSFQDTGQVANLLIYLFRRGAV